MDDRDDVLGIFQLEGLRKRLIKKAAQAGIEEYIWEWQDQGWLAEYHLGIVDEAIDQVFTEAEQTQGEGRPFRRWFVAQATRAFEGLLGGAERR